MTAARNNSLIQHFLKECNEKQENDVTNIPLNVLGQPDHGHQSETTSHSASTEAKKTPVTPDDRAEIETTLKSGANEIETITSEIEEYDDIENNDNNDVTSDIIGKDKENIKRISIKLNHTIFRCIECEDEDESHLYFRGFKKFHLIPEKDLLYSELLESYRDKVSKRINGLWYRVRKKNRSAFIPITWRTYLVDYIYLRHEVSDIMHTCAILY